MSILVTGSDGFVGINIVKKLMNKNEEIICTSRKPFSGEKLQFLNDNHSQLKFEKLEVTNPQEIEELFRKYPIRGIIHAAAVTPTHEVEWNNPELVMRVNIGGTINILEAARKHGTESFVFVSSNGLYGKITSCDEVIHEDHFPDSESLYGIAKYTGEAYCRRIAKITGMKIVSGRVCSTYGPMEAPTASRKHMSTVHDLIYAAREHREIKVVRPEIKRNWTHIYDIAGALCALLYADSPSYSEYNLSAGKNYSLTEVAETIKEFIPDFKFTETSDPQEADIVYNDSNRRGFLDAGRLFNDIGYRPEFGELKEGIRQYIHWLESHEF